MSVLENILPFLNGMVAGWSQVFVMQPFQIIKVRLQTQNANAKTYNGIVDCFTKIVKNEGPLALYKGTLTPFIGVGILGAIRFGLFENAKMRVASFNNKTIAQMNRVDIAISAFLTGLVTSLFVVQMCGRSARSNTLAFASKYKNQQRSFDALMKIAKEHGIRGLNRGQGPTTVRESTGLMLYFSGIEGLTKALTPAGITNKKDVPVYVPLIAGGVGGTFYWVLNYPFDYVKTLMQSDKLGAFKYPNMWSCFRDQYKQNGITCFYKGYLICMLRSFPVNAAAIFTYRIMQRLSEKN